MNKKQQIKCKSWQDAEEKVLEMLDQGIPWAKITQTMFEVDNQKRRFNPKKISEIKKRNSSEIGNNQEMTLAEYIDEVSSLIFQDLRNGRSCTDIVIQRKLDPKAVQKAFESYISFNKFVLCPKEVFESMASIIMESHEAFYPDEPMPKIDFKEISDYLSDLHLEAIRPS